MIRWNLTGTEAQKAIATEAFNRIKFPFDRLTQLPGSPELGWDDLNARSHSTHSHEGHGDRADPLVGTDEQGRKWTMGVIYTMSGRIYIDTRCEADPELAMAVIGAEIAHAVDFFLPMTDEQREELMRLWGVGGTWWEVEDYSAEYFRLGGEAFMHEFVGAYSDLDFGSTGAFMHDSGVEPADVRRILGIERTDEPQTIAIVRFGKSQVYHLATHKLRGISTPISDATALRPCKVCKP